MEKKTIILYDLKDKTQVEKVQALRKMFGYRDKSNYDYQYERKGEFSKLKFKRYQKAVLELQNDKDLAKVTEIFKRLKVNFEIAKIQ